MSKPTYVEVILPLALPKLYTYSLPVEMVREVKVGGRVVVQFGRKKLYSALVFRVHNEPPLGYKTKDILQVIDTEPIVPALQLKFWEWVAAYYMCSLGDVMKAGLPAGLKMEVQTQIALNNEQIGELEALSPEAQQVVNILENKKGITIEKLLAQLEVKNPMGLVKRMLDNELLVIEENIVSAFQPKFENFVRFHPQISSQTKVNEVIEQLSRAPSQQKCVMAMLLLTVGASKTFSHWVSQSDLLQKAQVTGAIVKALQEKGVLETKRVETSRLQIEEEDMDKDLTLTQEQEEVTNSIKSMFVEKDVVLLHGVTSSGKTELYIHLIKEQIEQGKQVLYLLPEIALTAQIINRLKHFFGSKVGVYHSKFSDNQRVEVYKNLLTDGEHSGSQAYDVILGVRSSVYLPFKRLGLVIVDEEHENTYKQISPAPRYHARDSSIVLAKLYGAKVLLGTATPSVESYYNAKYGKYGFAELTQRYMNIQLPKVEVVNMRKARKSKQVKSIFSNVLLDRIEKVLGEGHQVILFQNRRGYAPFIECDECAWVPQCEHCAVSLTLHKHSNQLVCHYCGYSTPVISSCLACGSPRLSNKGYGTEQIEEELAILFPHARIKRLDVDSTRSRTAYERIISALEQREVDVLVGTQMVAKGLNFDGVRLVGVLNADNMLNFPDFRAHERSLQLLVQVSGRAGRKDEQGEVLLQTSNPDHPVIKQVVETDVIGHLENQLAERLEFYYPPFYRLIRLSVRHKDAQVLNVAAEQLGRNLRAIFSNRVLGPEEPLISRIQSYYIQEILLKFERTVQLNKAKAIIQEQIISLLGHPPFRGVVVFPDVDPM